jgi:hypothetical protein
VTGAGPTTEQADLFETSPGLSSRLEPGPSYFDGFALDDLTPTSRDNFGLEGDGTVTRHSYLYQADYAISRGDESDIGKIELRGWTWTYHDDLPEPYWQMLEAAAHRSAVLFNTAIEVPGYAGYLDGFDAGKGDLAPPASIRDPDESYESENISVSEEGAIGAVVWSVEIYDENARLRGVAQGTAYPWQVSTETIPGAPAQSVAPHKWDITYNSARDAYQVAPKGRTSARQRYQPGGAANDKTVYVNGHPVGTPDDEGRRLIKNEYQNGQTYRGRWSRRGIIEDDPDATAAALRKGGTLYLTGETEERIDLVTARAKPDGWKGTDSDDVSPDLVVQSGSDGETRNVLDIRDTTDTLPVECRRDETIIDLLGLSTPTYRHTIGSGWWAV